MCVKNRKNIFAILITSIIVIGVALYLFPKYYLPHVFYTKYLSFSHKPKMLVVWRNGLGERELGERIMKIAPKLGIKAKFVVARNGSNRTIYDRYIQDQPTLAANAMQPDFVLIIDRAVAPIAGFANYVVLDQRFDAYIENANETPVFINPYHYEFAGLFPTFKELDLLKATMEAKGLSYKGFNWQPTVHATQYFANTPNRLFFPAGALSDPTRSSDKYKQIYSLLDKTGYFEVYGWQERLSFLQNSYKGYIPIDGESLLRISNAAGISLVLHDIEHLQSATPTGRIFEAAAANTLIIADKHAFIETNFGDNVLYLDMDQDPEKIFQQIDTYVKWAHANPESAKAMAQRCHQIFLEKFTLEDLMQRVLDLALNNKTV